jgi:copper chaperone CopZ
MTSHISPRLSAAALIALILVTAVLAGCLGNKDTKTPPGGAVQAGTPQAPAQSAGSSTTQPAAGAPVEKPAATPTDAVKPPQLVTVEFAVTGMKDAQSASAIESALIQIDGVSTVSANDKTGSTKVQYDPAKVTNDQLIAAIKKLGYKAKLNAGV